MFLLIFGFMKETDINFILGIMALYSLVFGLIWAEACWKMLWFDNQIALSNGAFVRSTRLWKPNDKQEDAEYESDTEAENVTDDEGDATGHAKTE